MSQRLLHLSDPHFGAADERVADSFLIHAEAYAPDLTILSGDLTMRARRVELAAARAFVDRLPAPRLIIPGNHDIPGVNHPLDRFLRPFRRYRASFGGDLEPSFHSGQIEVVSLNSSRAFGLHADWSEGRVSRRQLRRVLHRFRGPAPGLRVLVLHHPLLAPTGHRRSVVKPLAGLLRLLAEARVDLVLCGHFHQSCIAVVGGETWRTVVSQAPTVCSTRLQGEPPGFHAIHHEDGLLRLILHRYGDRGFTEHLVSDFRRGPSGWQPVA